MNSKENLKIRYILMVDKNYLLHTYFADLSDKFNQFMYTWHRKQVTPSLSSGKKSYSLKTPA